MVAPEQWQPIPLLQALDVDKPGAGLLVAIDYATRASLVASLLGVATNVSLLLAFALQLFQEACVNSLGKVTHATLPILYALLFLACSPCGRVLSLDAVLRRWRVRRQGRSILAPARSRFAAWPFELLFVELAAFYFQAGVAKLRTSGLRWADGYTLQFYLLDKGEPAGMWLSQHLWLCAVLSAAVLAFEVGFPLAVIIRRWRPAFLLGGFAFHAGTSVFLGVTFWPVWALYLLLVPWTALGGRSLGRGSDGRFAASAP